MQIIKECRDFTLERRGKEKKTITTCFLRADELSCSLVTLTTLFNEAKKDFPELEPKDIFVTRSEALTGISRATAGNAGIHVTFDTIQFRATRQPPPSYRRLPSAGAAQG